jgi:thiamine kinase-like enzyme
MSKSKGTIVRLGEIYKEYMEDWLFEDREGLPNTPVTAVHSKPGLDQMIDSFVDIPKDISIEEFRKRVDTIYDVFLERMNTPAKQFRNVVCHGDLYASNMLIKYNEAHMAENCFIVDFQGLRYAPITQDMLMLAYFSTNKNVRDKYLDKLLEEYYQELTKIMVQFGLDVNTFYSPEEFRASVKYMKPIVIMGAIFYAQVIAISPEKREEILFDESNFKYYLYENRKEYVKYILTFCDESTVYLKELIEDLYDVCVNNDSI